MPEHAHQGREIDTGVYEVWDNGEIKVKNLRGLINRGGRDCTAHIYRHEGGGWGGARGKKLCELTLMVDEKRMPPTDWLPPEEHLLVEVADFVPKVVEPSRAVQWAKSVTDLRRVTVPVPEVLEPYGRREGEYHGPAPAAPVTSRGLQEEASMLFPGFQVSCIRCGSVNISLTNGTARTYLECESCGTICRIRLP